MAGTGTLSLTLLYRALAQLTSTGDLASSGPKVELPQQTITLSDGTGDAQVNRVYADVKGESTLAQNIDVYDFGGELDELGRSFALAKIKVFLCVNHNSATDLSISGGTNPWFFPAGGLVVKPGGFFFKYDPAGITVTDGSAHEIIIDPDSGDGGYSLLIAGSQ